MMKPALALENVSRSFTVKQGFLARAHKLLAVDNASLELNAGECLGLVGESGCGKSTLGRIACGLLRQDSGSVLLHGRALPAAGPKSWAAGKTQMIFQDPASSLNPRMTALSSVAEPLVAKKINVAKSRLKAEEILAIVGLPGMGSRYPHQFSGGQRQRIAIARALITHPDAIICDEPVSALDASVQSQILNLLCDLQEKFKPAYLFISHDLAVVGFMCRRIMVMYLGRIVEEGSREELFANAAHPYTRALLAAMPKRKADAREYGPVPHGELPSPFNPPSGCHFHPRCPQAQKICEHEIPAWKTLAPGWKARCHFAARY